MSTPPSTVLVEQQDGIATITLNRPERRNGVTVPMCWDLYHATRAVAASDARVAILRGAGDDFCVGADILAASEEGGLPATAESLGPVHHAATFLHQMPQVTIAAIDGGCAGAGLGWAAACDFRFASTRAKFSTAFLTVGVSGDMGLAWSLQRILGGARMRELLFFPEKFDAARALEIDLVTRLFEADELHARTRDLARELCGRDPFVLGLTKKNCLSAETLSFADFIDIEGARQLQCFGDPAKGAAMADAYRREKDR